MDGILKRSQVLQITGRSISSLRRDVIEGRFPEPVKTGPRSVGWLASDVQMWLAKLREPGMKGQAERWEQLQEEARHPTTLEIPEIYK